MRVPVTRRQAIAAAALTACCGTGFAQSAVKIYGILDTGIESTRLSSGAHLTRVVQTGHVPSRLGFEGSEELGGGLKAMFRLEQGIGVDTGSALQGGRAFGREAYVGLSSAQFGAISLGRQYAVMQSVLAFYDPDHLSPYSPALAGQLSNIEQTSQDNVIKFRSPTLAGFTGTLSLSLAEGASASAANGPQVVGSGTLQKGTGALLEYRNGPLSGGLGYQGRRQTLDSGGSSQQQLVGLGAIYDLGRFDVGALAWTQRNRLSTPLTGATPTTRIWTIGAAWKPNETVRVIAQYGQAIDNGIAYASGAPKARGTDSYLNIGADYNFSKTTHVYVRVGRIADENGGFNGRAALAAPSIRDATPLASGQSMRGIIIGLRKRF